MGISNIGLAACTAHRRGRVGPRTAPYGLSGVADHASASLGSGRKAVNYCISSASVPEDRCLYYKDEQGAESTNLATVTGRRRPRAREDMVCLSMILWSSMKAEPSSARSIMV